MSDTKAPSMPSPGDVINVDRCSCTCGHHTEVALVESVREGVVYLADGHPPLGEGDTFTIFDMPFQSYHWRDVKAGWSVSYPDLLTGRSAKGVLTKDVESDDGALVLTIGTETLRLIGTAWIVARPPRQS